ncbi:MAG: hypothetical protein AAGA16_19535 [Cyanobacteria bacterium P01_E01_bin.35]
MTLQPILKSQSKPHSLSTPHQPTSSISEAVKQRLGSLSIPLDSFVLKAIALHHSSQVTAALNHVEANFELIRSPQAVFLYQLPKQKIEENRPYLPVYTARDFPGYTLQHLKVWYPHSWRAAAVHFGISKTMK